MQYLHTMANSAQNSAHAESQNSDIPHLDQTLTTVVAFEALYKFYCFNCMVL